MIDIQHSYCKLALSLDENHPHRKYHDRQYGFPIHDDNELFGRLLLEINQAGLSWLTILKKQDHFKQAYSAYRIEMVADYGPSDIDRLMANAGIIRNKLKINAAIHNARSIIEIQRDFGSFEAFLYKHIGLELKEWVKLFKQHFKFTGGEICNEFLMSSSYLAGAHDEHCPIHHKILSLNPKWLSAID